VSESEIKAVLFDAGQTIIQVATSVGAVYSRTALRHGVLIDPSGLQRSFRTAWRASLARGEARDFRCSDAILREEWRLIVRDTFPDTVSDERLAPIFEELYAHFSTASAWRVAPGALEAIESLRALGVRIGLLSNWDSRLPPMLDELGLTPRFDFTAISFELGVEKPHPDAFRLALRRAGTRPQQTLHVGDSVEADILPAKLLGIRTLWVAPPEELILRPDLRPGLERFPEDASRFWQDAVTGRLWDGHEEMQPLR
jgi:putative hydrolase of the HAD superfamily